MCVRKGKCCLAVRGEEKYEINSPESPEARAAGGEEVLQLSRAETLLQFLDKNHGDGGLTPCGPRGSRNPHCSSWRTPCCSSLFLKELQHRQRAQMEQSMKICSPWRGPRLEQKTAWGGRSSREELLWTDPRPHSSSLTLLGEERVKETGVKSHFYLGKRQKWGVDGFSYVFVSRHLIVYWFSCDSIWPPCLYPF